MTEAYEYPVVHLELRTGNLLPAGGEIALWQPKSQAIDRDPARPRTSTTEWNAR